MNNAKMKIVDVRLDEIKPYENNPRTNDSAVKSLADIIERLGFRNPAVLNKDKVIIEGHTRYKACRLLGWETMPCIIATDLTPEQEQALRIADNKVAEIAEWDEAKLKVELVALQDAGFDLSTLAFTDDELDDILGGEAGTHGETEPDAVPETPEVPVSTPGEVYKLGKHLLVCGDSTKPVDVRKVCKDGEADLWLTDPPYNVDYHGGTGMTIMNDSMEDSKFREFLRSAFSCAEKALKPGGSFYIFHADSEGYNFRGGCFDVGLKVRQCLVWKKSSLVLGRQDYQWIHEPCQPSGTMVLTPKGLKPIERLRDGDRVVSYDPSSGYLKGLREGYPVTTALRWYDGMLYTVAAGDCSTRATDNHEFTVRFNPLERKSYCTYAMRRGDWWRIGQCRLSSDGRRFVLKDHCKAEGADAFWLLGHYEKREDAQMAVRRMSVEYSIPYAGWSNAAKKESGIRTEKWLAGFYSSLDTDALAANAKRLLESYGRSLEHPLYDSKTPVARWSSRTTCRIAACNLMPEIMQLPVPKPLPKDALVAEARVFDWTTIKSVERTQFGGIVYSLSVEPFGHYVADGIVTHNCLYGWKEGASHNWYSDRSQTTVMEFDKPKKNGDHPCLAPGNLVMTSSGYMPVGKIDKGMKVLSADGRFHEVEYVSRHPYCESIYRIQVEGTNIRDMATHNHPYLVARRRKDGGIDVDWVTADKVIPGDYLMTPQLEFGKETPLSELDAWCFGLWLAQGSVIKSGNNPDAEYPVFALDGRKEELRRKLVLWGCDKTVSTYQNQEGFGITVAVFDGGKGCRCVELCGKHAAGKRVSDEVFLWTENLRRAFFEGYMAGDGCVISTRGYRHSKTVSLALASQMRLLAESLGYKVAFYHRDAPSGTGIGDRKFKKTHDFYSLDYHSEHDSVSQRPFEHNGVKYWLRRVKNVAAVPYDGEVVNLSVEGSHTFQTVCGMTHNTMKPVDMLCYLIGNSTKSGETVLDTFGGSGSTLIACEKTGRACRTVELDPKFCDVIRRRWAEFVHGEGCDWQNLTPALSEPDDAAREEAHDEGS